MPQSHRHYSAFKLHLTTGACFARLYWCATLCRQPPRSKLTDASLWINPKNTNTNNSRNRPIIIKFAFQLSGTRITHHALPLFQRKHANYHNSKAKAIIARCIGNRLVGASPQGRSSCWLRSQKAKPSVAPSSTNTTKASSRKRIHTIMPILRRSATCLSVCAKRLGNMEFWCFGCREKWRYWTTSTIPSNGSQSQVQQSIWRNLPALGLSQDIDPGC